MSMPLDLYVIRHGESEANVIVEAGEQGDNSLYTQDNVTVPDRSWRLTATGRKQADCIGRWLVSQQQLFDRYMVSPYVRTRETAATMALPKAKWEENRVLRERSWGEINTITKDEFKTNYARNWNFKNTDPLYWRPPAGESIADVAEDRVHNILTSLSRKSDSESVVMVTHGDFMLALMLTIEDLADEDAGRSKWSCGANSSARTCPTAIWSMWCRPSTPTCWSITANSLRKVRLRKISMRYNVAQRGRMCVCRA